MKKLLIACFVFCVSVINPAFAQEPTKDDAVALVKKAADIVKKGGKDKLIADVNAKSEEWYKGELYLIVLGLDGTHIAHPTNSKLLGKAMLDVPDVNGKMFRQERVNIAKAAGEGWV